MRIKDISLHTFSEFAKDHELSSYAQTIHYAMLMSEYGYEYEIIGLIDDTSILAASLLLTKTINNIKYAYAPKGFLLDYANEKLLFTFTKELKTYLKKKDIAFVKINPEIVISNIDNKTFEKNYIQNKEIINFLTNTGYTKLKDNLYFEALFPRFTGIIDLYDFDYNKFDKNTRNKIKKSLRKGLIFNTGTKEDVKYLDIFRKKDSYYYKDFINIYSKDGDVDIFTVSINSEEYLKNSQDFYVNEYDNNQFLNEKMIKRSHSKNINKKMHSDKILLTYKNDVMEATKLVEENKNVIIAAALVVKSNNKVKVISSSYDKDYKRYVPNYFLYYKIIEHYSHTHDFLDLNGLSGDFSNTSPYRGLNTFKLGFKPRIIEYIGEFDLIVNEKEYYYLLKHKLLTKEFQKKHN